MKHAAVQLDDDEILAAYDEGESSFDIAKRLGCDHYDVRTRITRGRREGRVLRACDWNSNHTDSLHKAEVDKFRASIIDGFNAGESAEAIGARIGWTTRRVRILLDHARRDGKVTREREDPVKIRTEQQRASDRERNARRRVVRGQIVIDRATPDELRALRAENRQAEDLPRLPKTRAECEDGLRPCPFVSCKHHLYLDVNKATGAIKLNFPDLQVEDLPQTCTLDVAAEGGAILEEVAAWMNITRERVRQLETSGLEKLGPTLRRELGSAVEEFGAGRRHLPVVQERTERIAREAAEDNRPPSHAEFRVAAERVARSAVENPPPFRRVAVAANGLRVGDVVPGKIRKRAGDGIVSPWAERHRASEPVRSREALARAEMPSDPERAAPPALPKTTPPPAPPADQEKTPMGSDLPRRELVLTNLKEGPRSARVLSLALNESLGVVRTAVDALIAENLVREDRDGLLSLEPPAPPQDAENVSLSQRIVDELAKKAMTSTEMAEALSEPRNRVGPLLWRLAKDGHIKSDGAGLYFRVEGAPPLRDFGSKTRQVMALLRSGPKTSAELVAATGMNPREVNGLLQELRSSNRVLHEGDTYRLPVAAETPVRARGTREAVFEVLAKGPATPSQVSDALGRSRGSVNTMMWMLGKEGALVVDKWVYRLPGAAPSAPPPAPALPPRGTSPFPATEAMQEEIEALAFRQYGGEPSLRMRDWAGGRELRLSVGDKVIGQYRAPSEADVLRAMWVSLRLRAARGNPEELARFKALAKDLVVVDLTPSEGAPAPESAPAAPPPASPDDRASDGGSACVPGACGSCDALRADKANDDDPMLVQLRGELRKLDDELAGTVLIRRGVTRCAGTRLA